jgi:hypothetical protein
MWFSMGCGANIGNRANWDPGLVVDRAASTAFQISGSVLYLMRTNDFGANLRQSLRGGEANHRARDHNQTMSLSLSTYIRFAPAIRVAMAGRLSPQR